MKLFILTLLFLFTACGNPTNNGEPLGLNGVWTLNKEESPAGDTTVYPKGGQTRCKIFTADSLYFECRLISTPTGILVIPLAKGNFDIINKGNNELLYFEDKHPRPLQKLNDTTIVIQKYGREYTWIRNSSMTESRMNEIKAIVESDSLNNDSEVMRYVLSTSERELKTANNMLVYIITGLAIVLLLVLNHMLRISKHKKCVEEQLRQIKEERESRPQPVAKAIEQVENDFLQSDFYQQLHRRVSEGHRLEDADWKKMEQQLFPIYPNFINRLRSLCRMSDTERHVCILIKYHFSPSEMAQVLYKDISTISSIRARLYQKVFNTKGRAKDWDDFILSL